MPAANDDVKAIFGQALEVPPGDERNRLLDRACAGRVELRADIESLLIAAEKAGAFLQPRSSAGHSPSDSADALLGSFIGLYRLLEVIGEGGMGVVYLAEQKEPVERQVALKLVKPGMDSHVFLAHFEAERQALALLDHPNIARILDAGTAGGQTDEVGRKKDGKKADGGRRKDKKAASSVSLHPSSFVTGRPFFVMEFVRGTPITRYCDDKRLRLAERLELMIPVCQAIQHAHQKGIIHRDIKPSNVLVTEYDGRPVPKIIDFGVAKAIQTRGVSEGVSEAVAADTACGQIVGTIEYMSPEQAELDQLDIDTRTDIYSLGVLLYELLTGSTPFEKDELQKAGFHEMLRIIREDEPPTPSSKLQTSASLPSVAATRETEPARLTKTVRGELDWIVMKALDKDRNRRYASAAEFVNDLNHYLHNEPVQACRPSALYRFQKFVARNKVAFSTAALIVMALAAGAAISTWQAIRATKSEALALAHERQSHAEKEKAIAAAKAEAEQRERAEAQTRIVEEQRQRLEENNHVNSMLIEQLLNAVRDLPAKSADRHRLLTSALAGVERLDPYERLRAYGRIADAFRNNNDLTSAVKAYEAALIVAPHDPSLHAGFGDMLYRSLKFKEAEAAFTRLIEETRTDRDAAEKYLPLARRGFSRVKLAEIEPALTDFRASHDAFPEATIAFLGKPFAHHYYTVLRLPNGYDQTGRLKAGFIDLLDRHVNMYGRSPQSLLLRADTLAYYGEFSRVCEDCEAAIEAGSPSYSAWYSLAVASLKRGDEAAYRRTAQGMLKKFTTPSTPDEAAFTAFVCGLAPGAVDDYSEPVRLAEWSAQRQPAQGIPWLAWGLCLLRHPGPGSLDAHKLITAAMKHPDGSQAFGEYLLAILYHHEGRPGEARQQLARAEASPKAPAAHWRYYLHIELFRREARKLIEPGIEKPD